MCALGFLRPAVTKGSSHDQAIRDLDGPALPRYGDHAVGGCRRCDWEIENTENTIPVESSRQIPVVKLISWIFD
jgi:hypothetical protein